VLPDQHFALWLRLTLVRYLPGLGRPLMRLAFIHYARWTVLKWLPSPDGKGKKVKLRSRYLLFESNYDGTEASYLDTFAQILPLRLSKLFGTCFGWSENVEQVQGAGDRVVVPWAFRDFVEKNELAVPAFYAAYPSDTVTSVRQAIAIKRLRRRRGAERLAVGPPTGGLGVWEVVISPFLHALVGRYGVNPFVAAVPLTPETDLDAFKQTLEQIRLEVLGAHFARVALIPRTLTDVGQPDVDDVGVPYVLFSCNHFGRPDALLERFARSAPRLVKTVFGQCADYPGTDDPKNFRAWLKRHSLGTRYYVAGYAPYPVDTLLGMLGGRREIRDRALKRMQVEERDAVHA
jgi:hypothetical protein